MSGGPDSGRKRVSDLLDGVRWDYDPKRADRSPLVSATRYFADFPWNAGEPAAEGAAETGGPGSGTPDSETPGSGTASSETGG